MKKTNELEMVKGYEDFCPNPHCNWTSNPYFAFEIEKRVEICPLCDKKLIHRDRPIEVDKKCLHLLEASKPGIDINSYIVK